MASWLGGIDPRCSPNLFHGSHGFVARTCYRPSGFLLLVSREGIYYILSFKKKQSFFFFRPFPLKQKQIHELCLKEIEVFAFFFWGGWGGISYIPPKKSYALRGIYPPLTTRPQGSSRDQRLHPHPGCWEENPWGWGPRRKINSKRGCFLKWWVSPTTMGFPY